MTYQYTMCGLDYVYLRNGYRKHTTDYGEGISIAHADGLDKAIARNVVLSTARLRGQEVRFFRSLVHLSQAELALRLGVKRITVARWESAPNTPIPGPADRLVRLVSACELFGRKCLGVVMESLAEISDEEPADLIMAYVPDEEGEPSLFPKDKDEPDGWRKSVAA